MINGRLMLLTCFGGKPVLDKHVIRCTAWLCVFSLLLTACAPLVEAQVLHTAESYPTLDVPEEQPIRSEAPPVEDFFPTPEVRPALPPDFDPSIFLADGLLEVESLPGSPATIRSGQDMLLIIFPLLKDTDPALGYHYDTGRGITLLRLPEGFLLGTGEQYALRAQAAEGQRFTQEVQAAVLPNLVGGQPLLGLVVLTAGVRDLASGEFFPERDYAQVAGDGVLAEATYFGGRDTIYPNKLVNILIAASYLAEAQGADGPFRARAGYSFNRLIRLRGGDTLRYANGVDNVWAAGVCAVASLTSASLYQLSQALEVDYTNSLTAIIRTQYQHKIAAPYAASPYFPVEVDTVVAVLPDVSADLVWQMPPEPRELYLGVEAIVLPNELAFADTAADGASGLSDAELLLTFSFTNQDPGPQAGTLQSLLSAYRTFRSSEHANAQSRLQQGTFLQRAAWDAANWQTIALAILPLN